MSEEQEPENYMSDLELILQGQAQDHFVKAMKPGTAADFKKYFKRMIDDVSRDFKNQKMISRTVYDFATDRYIFHRRHKELDHAQAVSESYIDTFEYLIRLKNDFPMQPYPPMRDDWRKS